MAEHATSVVINSDRPDEWTKFEHAQLDVVPDPMVVRTGELFVSGRSGALALGLNPDEVWCAIDKNLGALFAFFDALVTRDRLPYIQYAATFAPTPQFSKLIGTVLVPVVVSGSVYDGVKRELSQQITTARFDELPQAHVSDIVQELDAYGYSLELDITGLDVPADHLQVAQFFLGGLIFGAYAQASGCDHLIQSKRSRLFLELSMPRDQKLGWGSREEDKLFAAFRRHCIDADRNIRADDYPAAPTVLPYLLKEGLAPNRSQDVLEKCIELRETRLGRDYREWMKRLRAAWSKGERDVRAENSVETVLRKLQRSAGSDVSTTGTRVELGLNPLDGMPTVSVTNIPLRVPAWLRLWIAESLTFRPHRRLLMRMGMGEGLYSDITHSLHALWKSG